MVPYPLPPIGRVTSGIMTFSSFEVSDAERIQLPCPFSYPIRLCNLKRCLIVSRIPIAGSEHELVIVNLHLEAYDSGEGKAAQLRHADHWTNHMKEATTKIFNTMSSTDS